MKINYITFLRYCSSLPQDQYCHLTVKYWIEKVIVDNTVNYIGCLKFPINCPIRRVIQVLYIYFE